MLYLLRHAKSSWDDPALPDFDRPLAPRGRRAAAAIATYLGQAGIVPGVVLCSPARRARETLDAVIAAFGTPVEVRVENAVYDADAPGLLALVKGLPDGVPSAMVVGHNPGLQEFAIGLCADGEDRARGQLRAKFPTGALATVDLGDIGWSQVRFGCGCLTDLVMPRTLH
jgi:phosphohistidine phosphatase